MQRFLARGKRIEDGKWVYGYLFAHEEDVYILGELDPRETIYDVWKCAERVDPETVGRLVNDPCYTDYTEQRYFQGDIIELFSYKHKPLEERVGIVVDEHCFTENGRGRCFPQDTLQARVIGNVWDNPELVGEKYAELYKHYHHRADTRE